ncbi:MAG: hypothetical protein WCS01_15945, partial [bacterium]
LGMAEAILQRALLLSPPPPRVAVAEELVRLYTERMKWPQGVLRLHDEWPRLGAGAPVPEFLKSAAVARREADAMPLPPWRLVWRQKAILKNVTYAKAKLTPAGLLYWDGRNGWMGDRKRLNAAAPIGCLSLETGLPRWQRDVVLNDNCLETCFGRVSEYAWSSMHFLVLPGEDGLCIDLWSGAAATNPIIRASVNQISELPLVGRFGVLSLALPFKPPGGSLTGVDVLTGQTLWRRSELTSLTGGARLMAYPVPGSAAGTVLQIRASLASLDPGTGEIGVRHPVDVNSSWMMRLRNRRGVAEVEDLLAPELRDPVLENQRLIVRNPRTDAVVWTSPPDLAIILHKVMPNGLVLAQTADEELLLFDGTSGKILRRSEKVRFPFHNASRSEGSDAVIVTRHQVGPGTNNVLVLDPAVNRIAFQGRLPPGTGPLLSLGPTMPDQLLVSAYSQSTANKKTIYQTWYQVINAQGENTNGWRLPKKEEMPDAGTSCQYNFQIAGRLIVLFDLNSGDALAYEHDPGDGGKKP